MDAMAKASDIGGGIVRRRFTLGDQNIVAGTALTAAQIGAMANRRTLIRNGNIETYPRAPGASAESAERHIVGGAGGRFSVIEGRKLNDEPLTRDQAEELATRP